MHTAFSTSPVLVGHKDHVDSLLIHAGNVVLGGPNSLLSAFKLPERAQDRQDSSNISAEFPAEPVWAVRTSRSAKSIEQLRVIREANLFVSLSDSTVSLHDIAILQDVASSNASKVKGSTSAPFLPDGATVTLPQTKGALTFTIDTSVQKGPSRQGFAHDRRGAPSTIGRAYRPSDATLGKKFGGSTVFGNRPLPASLRGMEDLQRDKEERMKYATLNARRVGGNDAEDGVMALISTLAVACRRKLVIFRWMDGGFWDTKEINLPHTPRSLAFPTPNMLFMGYTSSDYAILSIPLASSSSVADLADPSPATAASEIPSSSISGKRVDLYEWNSRSLSIPISSTVAEQPHNDAFTANPQATGSAPGMAPSASASGGMAAMAGAAFGGLGGYIGMGSKTKPMIIQIEGGEVLVCRDGMGIFLSEDGKPTRRDGIEWSASPNEVVYGKPYVFSLLPAGASGAFQGQNASFPQFQIRSASTLKAVQTLPFPPPVEFFRRGNTVVGKGQIEAAITCAGQSPSVKLLSPSPGAKTPLYVVVSPTERGSFEKEGCSIWCIEMKSWSKQVDEMVELEQYQEALALLDSVDDVLLEDKPQRRAYVEGLYAVALFSAGRYDEAIELFIDLEANPARVIALYPEEISGPLARDESQWLEIFGGPKKEMQATPEESSEVVQAGEGDAQGKDAGIDIPPGADSAAISRDRSRLTSLFGRRPQSNVGGDSTPQFSSSPAKGSRTKSLIYDDDDAKSIRSTKSTRTQQAAHDRLDGQSEAMARTKQEQDKYRRSTDALGRFLADRRRIFKPILETDASLHSVSKSQIRRDPEWLLSIPSVPLNALPLEELTAVAQTVDTALFKTFLVTKPALVGPLCRVENWCEVEQVEGLLMKRKKFSELIALYGTKEMHDKALKLLRGFSEEEEDIEGKVGPTIRYLQNLGPEHINLILDTSHWVLEVDRSYGMEIFTADAGKVATFPRFVVVSDLEKFDEDLCRQYLEYLIDFTGEGDPSLHEKLAVLLLRKATQASDEEVRSKTLDALLAFLHTSQQYRAERILSKLPADDAKLYEIRALLLGRLGQHEGALGILVHKLKDHEKAEAYCRRVYDEIQDEEVFFTLLRIYLRPKAISEGEGKEGASSLMLGPALRLISRHGARIDSVAALELLPPLVSLSEVNDFASKALHQLESNRNEQRVLQQVSKERSEQVSESLALLHSRRVKVTESKTCPRCMKRLGNSVIAVSTTGAVFHYSCR